MQGQWVALGIVAMAMAYRFPVGFLQRRAGFILLVSIVLCAIVLVPGIGRLAGGARRWISVFGFGFQPSELAKLAAVIFMAAVLARREETGATERKGLLIPIGLVGVAVGLIFLEPD